MLLVTRDGNNELVIIAWCTCLKENGDNYTYFAEHCKKAGLSAYLDRAEQLLYSDRHKGIPMFEKLFKCGTANCVVHIIKNLRKHLRKTPGAAVGFHDDQIHNIQKAVTKREHLQELNRLRRNYPDAAEYVANLKPEKTFTYALVKLGYATHRHGTSNLVEILNSVLKIAREDTPYWMNDHIVIWIAKKLAERQKIAANLILIKALYTPYAMKQIAKQELKAREEILESKALGAETYLVTHQKFVSGEWLETRHRVDLRKSTCDCGFFLVNHLPCLHAIYIIDSCNDRSTPKKMLTFRENWVPAYFHAESYIQAYDLNRCVIPPFVDQSLNIPGVTDAPDRVLPPRQPKRKKGRHKLNRAKSKKKRSRAGTFPNIHNTFYS